MEQSVNAGEISRISAGTVLKGEINSPNDLRIDGTFEGKIISRGKVVVGDKAVLNGDIIADNVDFFGKLTGGVFVKDTITLKAGCQVDGDLHVRRFSLELGAKFNGKCKMLQEGEFEKLSESLQKSGVQEDSVEAPAPKILGGARV